MECQQFAGIFALSSAISSHLFTRTHLNVKQGWISNKWFWAGLFGNLPALVAIVAHIYLSRERGEARATG